jgi:hypothetical protein
VTLHFGKKRGHRSMNLAVLRELSDAVGGALARR